MKKPKKMQPKKSEHMMPGMPMMEHNMPMKGSMMGGMSKKK